MKRLLLFPGYEDPPQQQQQQQPGESQLELTTRRSSGYHGGHGPEDGPEMEPMDPGGGGGSAPPPTDLTLVKRDHHQPQPMQQPADVARGEGVVEEEDYPPFPKRHRALVKQVTLMKTCIISIQYVINTRFPHGFFFQFFQISKPMFSIFSTIFGNFEQCSPKFWVRSGFWLN